MRILFVAAFSTILAAGALPAMAQDRDPTADERSRIEAALKAEGFTRWDDIELDDGVWEVDDAIAADGKEYDLKLDMDLKIVERD